MDEQTGPALSTARAAGALAIAGAAVLLAAGFLPLLRLDGAAVELAGLDPGRSLSAALASWFTTGAHAWGSALAVGIVGVSLLASPWSGGLRSGVLLAIGLSWLALLGHLVFQPLPGAAVAPGLGIALVGVAMTILAALLLLGPAPAGRPTGWVVRLVMGAGVVGGTVLAWTAIGEGESLGLWALRAIASLPFFLLAVSIAAARARRHPRYTIVLGVAAIVSGVTLLLADVTGRRPGPFLYAALAVFVAGVVTLIAAMVACTMRRPTSAAVISLLGIAALVAASLLPLSGPPSDPLAPLVSVASPADALAGAPLPAMLVGLSAAGALVLLLTHRKRLGAGLLAGTGVFALTLFPTLGWEQAPRPGVLFGLTAVVLLMLASLTGLGEPEAVRPIPEGDLELLTG